MGRRSRACGRARDGVVRGSNFYTATRRAVTVTAAARIWSQISCSPSYYKSGFNSAPGLFRFSFGKLLASDTRVTSTGRARQEKVRLEEAAAAAEEEGWCRRTCTSAVRGVASAA